MKADCGIWTLPICFIRFLPFFCLSRASLARDVAAVALGRHVLAQRLDGLSRDDLAAERRLDRDLEELARDQVF